MVSDDDFEKILNTFGWIKVKRYVMDESLSWEERYKQLDDHHQKETTFLINKVREMVRLLKLKENEKN